MSSEQISTLLEMGFSKDKAERALQVTGNQGVEAAMEWLLAHGSDLNSTTEPPTLVLGGSGAESNTNVDVKSDESKTEANEKDEDIVEVEGKESSDSAQAKSLKCNECGKLFKDGTEIEFHAVKTGHKDFEECTEEKKPLTEEEKQEQLRRLEEKLKRKRLEREQRERTDELEREKTRIKSGKELGEYRKKLEETEMKKIVEDRRREKVEEQRARERVRAQIEEDKRARRAKAAAAQGIPIPESDSKPFPAAASTPSTSTSAPAVQKDYSQARLQIRLTNGEALTQTFGAKEQLSAVRLFVQMNRTDGDCPFNLMTTFPKKVFSSEDYEKPLDILGLVPSSVLIVSKDTTR